MRGPKRLSQVKGCVSILERGGGKWLQGGEKAEQWRRGVFVSDGGYMGVGRATTVVWAHFNYKLIGILQESVIKSRVYKYFTV